MGTNSLVVECTPHAAGGRIARLTIDNAEKSNSLNRTLMTRFAAAVEGLADDPELRLAVLTGAGGRAFVGGADIGEIAALDHAGARQFITLVHRCCRALRYLPFPVVARIDGPALGAGLELACACDLRVASDRSAFGMPEVQVGIPSVVEAALLPRFVGWGRARRLLLTGEPITADEALSWGLIDRVVPASALGDAIDDFARPILAAGPQALRLQKELIRDWEELPTAAAIRRGIDRFVEAFDTDEPARLAGAAIARLRARRKAGTHQ